MNDGGARALFHPDNDFRPLTLTGAIYDRVLRTEIAGAATAMRVVRETEFAAAKLDPQKKENRCGDDEKRNHLLPVHVRNITSKSRAATGHLQSREIL